MKKDRFDKIIEENYPALLVASRSVLKIADRTAEAEDLLQNVILECYERKLWLRLHTETKNKVLQYLRKMITSRAIDFLRSTHRDILAQAAPLEQVDKERSYDLINALDQIIDHEKVLAEHGLRGH